MDSSFLAILAAGLLSLGPIAILAQITSNAACLSSFNWMLNSLGQNPCLVTAFLAGVCTNGTFGVPAIQAGSAYIGPSASGQNPCQCSSVLYNTLSACALCQGTSFFTWSQWNFNCTTVSAGVFAPGIPIGTTVPHWAFQDVTMSNLFNATLAHSVGDTPESSALLTQSTGSPSATSVATSASGSESSPPQSTTMAVVSSVSPSSPSQSTPTSTANATSGNGSKTVVITGGVVGGVAGLLIVGAIAVHALKRRHDPPPTLAAVFPKIVTPREAVYTSGTDFGLADASEMHHI